jgi:hypothetical protein
VGICVSPAIGVEPRRRSAPIAAHVAASNASKGFNEESLLIVMMFLVRR